MDFDGNFMSSYVIINQKFNLSIERKSRTLRLIIKKVTHNAVRRSGATKPAGKSELPIRLMLFLKILLILKRNSIFLFYDLAFGEFVALCLFFSSYIALFHYFEIYCTTLQINFTFLHSVTGFSKRI